MAKVIINGQEVVPAKKVKLTDHMSPIEIRDLIKKKSEEQRNVEQPSGDQE